MWAAFQTVNPFTRPHPEGVAVGRMNTPTTVLTASFPLKASADRPARSAAAQSTGRREYPMSTLPDT